MTRNELDKQVERLNLAMGEAYAGDTGLHFAVLTNRKAYRHPIALFKGYEAKRCLRFSDLMKVAHKIHKAFTTSAPDPLMLMMAAIYDQPGHPLPILKIA